MPLLLVAVYAWAGPFGAGPEGETQPLTKRSTSWLGTTRRRPRRLSWVGIVRGGVRNSTVQTAAVFGPAMGGRNGRIGEALAAVDARPQPLASPEPW